MTRQRTVLGPSTRPCSLCGGADVVLVETRLARRGLAHLRPRWDQRVRTYDECRACGAQSRE